MNSLDMRSLGGTFIVPKDVGNAILDDPIQRVLGRHILAEFEFPRGRPIVQTPFAQSATDVRFRLDLQADGNDPAELARDV